MMALVSLVALRFLYVSYSQRRGGPRKTPSSDGFKFTAINPFVSTCMYVINYICLSTMGGQWRGFDLKSLLSTRSWKEGGGGVMYCRLRIFCRIKHFFVGGGY